MLRATTSARERDERRARGQPPRVPRQHREARRAGDEDGREHREARREVARRLPDVLADVEPAAGGDAGVESSRQHEVGEPEGNPEHGDGAERPRRLAEPVAPRDGDERSLRGEHERAVRVRGDGGENRECPERPGTAAAAVERAEQGEIRERSGEEEEAVHPAVDAVEEERPARCDQDRPDQRRHTAGKPREQERDDRQARDGEERRHGAQPLEAEVEVRDRPGEQEVERRAAALLEHDLEHLVEWMAADEERQRLVLVRRPCEQLVDQERRRRERHAADPEREPPGDQPRPRDGPLTGSETGCLCGFAHRRRQSAWLHSFAMPIYEYRCPDGHTFEVFQRMSDPPSEACEVCGKSPVEKVLYPVSVHFKGSGFYSTDYGRGSGKKKDAAKDGGGGESSSEKKSDSGDKKPAPAADRRRVWRNSG